MTVDILLRRGLLECLALMLRSVACNCLLYSLLLTSSWDYVVLSLVIALFRIDPYAVHHGTMGAF